MLKSVMSLARYCSRCTPALFSCTDKMSRSHEQGSSMLSPAYSTRLLFNWKTTGQLGCLTYDIFVPNEVVLRLKRCSTSDSVFFLRRARSWPRRKTLAASFADDRNSTIQGKGYIRLIYTLFCLNGDPCCCVVASCHSPNKCAWWCYHVACA